ncbi:MAG: hypothetical protein JNJ60_23005 [Rhodocyclaceae bacterium]|nr:hypothetical protein [Rhodocyclaceae bacterium]
MAERPEPYVRRGAGDLIRADDWNEVQVRAQEALQAHDHSGGAKAAPIGRAGIAPNAIDGSRIDAAASVKVAALEVTGPLKVNARQILQEIDALTAGLAGSPERDFAARNLAVSGRLSMNAGAILASTGNTDDAGFTFSKNPGGGGGDAAWLRYYPRAGESCTLELGIANDAADHIALMPSGFVGIGTRDPRRKLHVEATEIHSGGNVAGYSFANRESGDFVEDGGNGKRWVWYASSGTARLWSSRDLMWLDNEGNLGLAGRVRSANAAAQAAASDHVMTINPAWTNMPGMSLSVSTGAGTAFVMFKTGGVQGVGQATIRGHFRLLIDGAQHAYCEQEFHNNGWELRDVSLFALPALAAGSHQIVVQWRSDGQQVHASWYGDTRQIICLEL